MRSKNARKIPVICSCYNSGRGCGRNNCQHLHICLNFVQDRCDSSDCPRSHSVISGRNKRLLEREGWHGEDALGAARAELHWRERRRNIGVCLRYNLGRCLAENCSYMHVCYRHVRDRCPLDHCDLSHEVRSAGHNAQLLTFLELVGLSESTLLRRLKRNLQAPRPSVCLSTFGHHPNSCQSHCLRLHWCKALALGCCRFGDRCFNCHSLQDPHNREALLFFGWSKAAARAAIRQAAVDDTGSKLERGSEAGKGGETLRTEVGGTRWDAGRWKSSRETTMVTQR